MVYSVKFLTEKWLSLQAQYQQAHLCFSIWTFLQFRQINLKLFLQMSFEKIQMKRHGLYDENPLAPAQKTDW
ncbi:hypothetical protein T10_3949 [Trichinella papuae]|uniref:Uncharacterized protein n=1 Tax=Trichinella papuae TaxID=268474 RepID=A0A0V1MSP9_9BILA|nr:hypothetical protein T10_3949 [Trichinella papuae]